MKHDGKPTTYTRLEQTTMTAPSIKVSKNAVKWLTLLAEMHDYEIGVFGCIDETGENSYLIRDIFYPKHCEANAGTCEISPEGETLMAEWLISHGREADLGKVKFWGHSHHTMDVFASGQDESQALERMERTQSYFVRGIFNKEGKLSISFFDYARKLKFDHIKWETDLEDDEKIIRDKIEELKKVNLPVSKATYPAVFGNGVTQNYDPKDEFWKKNRYGIYNRDFLRDFDKTNKSKAKKNKGNGKEMKFDFEKQNSFHNENYPYDGME